MFLGIEIGGTKLQFGVGDGITRDMAEQRRLDVNLENGAAGILDQIAATVPALQQQHKIQSLGIGFGGPVYEGRVITSHQVSGWDDIPLAAWCRERFNLPTVLGNDCDSAAIAEASLGAGRDSQTVFYVTVGTGVGGGLVIAGRLHGTGRPAVAEIGHLRPGLTASQPTQTVESLTSGPAIAASACEALVTLPPDDPAVEEILAACERDTTRLSAKMLGELAEKGNRIAIVAFENAMRALGWAIAQTITLTSAEAIVVGGGVSLVGDAHFFDSLRKFVDEYVFPPLRGSYRIVPAELGEWVVVHGAIRLAALGFGL